MPHISFRYKNIEQSLTRWPFCGQMMSSDSICSFFAPKSFWGALILNFQLEFQNFKILNGRSNIAKQNFISFNYIES